MFRNMELELQERRLAVRAEPDPVGIKLLCRAPEDRNEISRQPIDGDGLVCVGTASTIEWLSIEDDADNFASAALPHPEAFYTLSVDMPNDPQLKSYFGYRRSTRKLYFEIAADQMWVGSESKVMAVQFELRSFLESNCGSIIFLDYMQSIRRICFDTSVEDSWDSLRSLWFAMVVRRQQLRFEVAELIRGLLEFNMMINYQDTVISQFTAKTIREPLQACVVSMLPKLPVHSVEDGKPQVEKIICQLSLVMRKPSEDEVVSPIIAWLALRQDVNIIVSASCLDENDLAFVGAVATYRNWHARHLLCSPGKVFESYTQLHLSKMRRSMRHGVSPERLRFDTSPVRVRVGASAEIGSLCASDVAQKAAAVVKMAVVSAKLLSEQVRILLYAFRVNFQARLGEFRSDEEQREWLRLEKEVTFREKRKSSLQAAKAEKLADRQKRKAEPSKPVVRKTAGVAEIEDEDMLSLGSEEVAADEHAQTTRAVGFLRMIEDLEVHYYYVFQLVDHSLRRLSWKLKERLPLSWKALVDDYHVWHQSEVFTSPVRYVEQCQEDVSESESDQDLEEELLDDQASYELLQKCRELIAAKGLDHWTEFRPPQHWSDVAKRECIKDGGSLPDCLPKIPKAVATLLSLHKVVRFELQEYKGSLSTMSRLERVAAFFGKEALLIGEDEESTDERLALAALCEDKQIVVAVQDIFTNLKELRSQFEKAVDEKPLYFAGGGSQVLRTLQGKNLFGQTMQEWRHEAGLDAGDFCADEEILEALKQMKKDGSRDAFEEARGSQTEKKSGASTFEDVATRWKREHAQLHDHREPLPKEMLALRYVWCARYECQQLLEPNESICVACRTPRIENCECEYCGTWYDPNRGMTCGSCQKFLPHAPLYVTQKSQEHQTAMMAGKHNKDDSAAKVAKVLDNAVLTKIMADTRGRVSTVMRMASTTAQLIEIIQAQTTSVTGEHSSPMPPIEGLTCPLDAEAIENIGGLKFGSLGSGYSIWQCIPYEGKWKRELYYNSDRDQKTACTAGGKLKTTTDLQKLMQLKQYMTVAKFKATMENYALIRSEWSNTAMGDEIRTIARMIEAYHLSVTQIGGERDLKANLAFWIDVIDAEVQRHFEMLREMCRVSRMLKDKHSAIKYLQNKFDDIDWEENGIEKVPPLVLRKFCAKHQDFSSSNWPKRSYECACEWSDRVHRKLEEFVSDKNVNVYSEKDGVNLYSVCQRCESGSSSDGSASSKDGGVPNSQKRGGYHDKLGDTGGEEYPYKRCKNTAWFTGPEKVRRFKKVVKEFNSLLTQIRVNNPSEYCLRLLGAKGLEDGRCQNNHCQRKHELPRGAERKITAALIAERPLLRLFFDTHFGGTIIEPNEDSSLKKLKERCLAMRKELLDAEEETEDEQEESSAVDEETNASVRRSSRVLGRDPAMVSAAGKAGGETLESLAEEPISDEMQRIDRCRQRLLYRVNSRSVDQDYDEVQADYIDTMVDELMSVLRESGLHEEGELMQIQADAKAAFKLTVIRLDSVGTLCVEFDGWIFVYTRTPFGWKWATHTWSIFAKAIKFKVRSQERNSFGSRILKKDWLRMGTRMRMLRSEADPRHQLRMKQRWFMNQAWMYVDDLYAAQNKDLHKAKKLADAIRTVGFLLLGYSAWSLSKAKEEGYFAWLQKHTGIVISTNHGPIPRLSFTEDRIDRCLEYTDAVESMPEATEYRLDFMQEAWGNFVWTGKVHRCLKAFSAAYRRALQGTDTKSSPDTLVSPKHPKDSKQTGANKFRKDNRIAACILRHLKRTKQLYGEDHVESTVPFSTLADMDKLTALDDNLSIGSIGGDASGTGWSVLDHRLNEIMIIQLPKVLSDVLRRKATLTKNDVRDLFMVSVAEHMVLVLAMLQWGERWKQMGLSIIKYHTDNQNSYVWTEKLFAGCELAQDLCRLIAVLEIAIGVRVVPFWVPTAVNKLGDLSSRIFRPDGTKDPAVLREFNDMNALLARPYRTVDVCEKGMQLINLVSCSADPFAVSDEIERQMLLLLRRCIPLGFDDSAEELTERLSSRGGSVCSMRQELEDYREGWTIEQAQAWSTSSLPAHSVGLVGGAGHIGSMGVTRAGGRILWGSEIDPLRQQMHDSFTGGTCLGDIQELDWSKLPQEQVLLITAPCVNHARSGNRLGRHGEVGYLYVWLVKFIMYRQPLVWVSELSDFADQVNNGEDVAMIIEQTRHDYVVYKMMLRMCEYGDPSHRKRLVLVGFHRSFAGADAWRQPTGRYSQHHAHTGRDIAEPDDAIADEDKRWATMHVMYGDVPKPPFGEMQKLGRLKPGFSMGPGWNPNLLLGWDGQCNGPTTHGGGGTFPPLNWRWGMELPWRRVSTIKEYYRKGGVSDSVRLWHLSFLQNKSAAEQKIALRGLIADGFFASTVHALFTSIFELLEKHGVGPDLPRTSAHPDEYVTEARWLAASGRRGGLGDAGRPSRQAVSAYMSASEKTYEEPLYPSKKGFRYHLAESVPQISDAEWAQMEYGERMADLSQTRKSTKAAYDSKLSTALEFLKRYPIEKTYTAEHAKTGLRFDPAVWNPNEVQAVLIDMVLHEAYVRGNQWGSCHQLLYAIRHMNVKELSIDILKNKPRLWQVMDGIKKCKGPKRSKLPVTRAMLLIIERMLNWETSLEEHKLWAATLMAFHFMLRSMDYCAKEAGGCFDLDCVLRVRDVVLKRDGKVLRSGFAQADELVVILGRGKTTEGGEVRKQFKSSESKLCVVTVVGLMLDRMDLSRPEEPLFAWPARSRRPGQGVRYHDMMSLLKAAAEATGRDTSKYGTHSLRRGGASSYLLAGSDVEEVALYGRWKDVRSCGTYVEPAVGDLMRGLQDKVNKGLRVRDMELKQPARARRHQLRRAAMQAAQR